MLRTILFVAFLLFGQDAYAQIVMFSGASVATSNSKSAVGTNLNAIGYASPEQPFVNVAKSSDKWITTIQFSTFDTGEEAALCVDADGYPTDLLHKLSGGTCTATPTFTSVRLITLNALPAPYYPAGTYDIKFDGTGTFAIDSGSDCSSLTLVGTGHYTSVVTTPSANGCFLLLLTTGTAPNNVHNLRMTLSTQTAAFEAGCIGGVGSACFNPKLIAYLKNFRALRFMDWMGTNGSVQTTWAGRPTPTLAFYGSSLATPTIPCCASVETMVSLCNTLNADCWFNMPVSADDTYVTNFATYVHSNLNSNLLPHVEYSNETWNNGFSQYTTLITLGRALFGAGCGGDASGFQCNRSYMGMRTGQMCQDWKTAWGADSGRVRCVLGSFIGLTSWTTDALNCALWASAPCTGLGINAMAIAPYFGCDAGTPSTPGLPVSWLSDSDGGLTNLFIGINTGGNMSSGATCNPAGNISFLAQTAAGMSAFATLSGSNGLELLAYEGGEGFVSQFYDPQFTTLFTAASGDSRMGTVYTSLFNSWKSNNGHLFMHFNDIYAGDKFGQWGLDTTVCDPNCASPAPSTPKYNALLAFIAANPCWWSNCTH